jgi:FkbM family methyltransferase
MEKLFFKLKSKIKKTRFWILLYHSDFYQNLRSPASFRKTVLERKFYKEFLNEVPGSKDLIFDIGANIGSKSAIFSKLTKRVIAFEPSPVLNLYLNKRFKYSNVRIISYAVGAISKTHEYFEVPGNDAFNSLSNKHIQTTVASREKIDVNSIRKRDVQVETLDYFIKLYGLPGYIKIDVEGYELEVINGLNHMVPSLSFECNLPEFLEEGITIIHKLSLMSSDKYLFNISYDNKMILDHFLNASETLEFLKTTNLRFIEVFAKVN